MKTILFRSPLRAAALAAMLVAAPLSLPGCVDPISSGVLVGGGMAGVDKLVDALNKAIEQLSAEIDRHRAQIKLDALEALAQAVEDAQNLSTHVGAIGGLLEGKVAADVAGTISRTTAVLDKLTRDVRAGASEAIMQTSLELSRLTKEVQEGVIGAAEDSARKVLAKARHDAEGAFVVVVGQATILAFEGVFGLVTLAGLITLVVTAARKSEKKRAGFITGALLTAAGVGLLVAAPRVAALTGERKDLPDVAAACKKALELGAEMERRAGSVASIRVSSERGASLSTGLKLDEAALRRALRGGAALDFDELERSLKASSGRWPSLPEVPAAVRAGQLELSGAGAAFGSGQPRVRQPVVRRGGLIPAQIPHKTPAGTPGAAGAATGGAASLSEIAAAIIENAGTCSVLGDNPVMVNTSETYLSRALAYLGIEVACRSTAQCPEAQWCDAGTRSCVPLGVYCEVPDHCAAGRECDRSLRRCAPRDAFRCAPTAPCRVGEVCTEQRLCVDRGKVVGQPCEDTTKLGPCRRGEWRDDGSSGVICVSTVGARAEECNGADDNCNGTIDELDPGALLASCVADALGICKSGREVCRGGQRLCEPRGAEAERCNGLDDNCNGAVDDDASCNPVEQVGGTIECGWNLFGSRTDIELGSDCTVSSSARYERFDWSIDGPQDKGRHAEVIGWVDNNPMNCRVNVHCGSSATQSGKWTVHVRAVKREH